MTEPILQVVPLSPAPNQTFRCILETTGSTISYRLELRFNTIGRVWLLTIYDGITDQCLIHNIPLRTGWFPCADLLSQSAYLGLGSLYIVPTESVSSTAMPDDTNLGTEFVMVWER